MAPMPTVIFDLDGTLVDTAPDLTGALNFVLRAEGRAAVALGEVRHMVGLGGRRLIERGLEKSGGILPEVEIDRLLVSFLEFYSENLAVESRVFAGVAETLDEIAATGARMGICTNKPEGLSVRLIAEVGLARHFSVILGADSVARRKPDPGHLLETIARLGGDRAFSVMVGDSENDVATARAAGVPVIAVSFGYSMVAPEELGADAVIRDFRQLPEVLKSLA